MKRVWLVDDAIPVHTMQAVGPMPLRFEAAAVSYLVEQLPADQWTEPHVLELCRVLCGVEFESTFFVSPEQALRALAQGATPPHAVIFDWDYPGSTDARNCEAIDKLLQTSFVYVQVYTHLGGDGVEPRIVELRRLFPTRLLPAKGKAEVKAEQLREDIRKAWSGTIAGEVADRVRSGTMAAVERTLIEMGSVPKSVLTAMTEGTLENLIQMVLAKVRDEIGSTGFEAFGEVFTGSQSTESTEAARRLLSVWYYYFPADDRVRPGDLIELDDSGNLGFVVTPVCDLASFPKKTGRRLTWVRAVLLDIDGITGLKDAGLKIGSVGNSIIAGHGQAGGTIILLPNIPTKFGSRESIADYALLCHAWDSRQLEKAADGQGGQLRYRDIAALKRRCTLADPYASGIIARIMSVISSPGTPDLPKGECKRLEAALTRENTPTATVASVTAAIAPPAEIRLETREAQREDAVPAPAVPQSVAGDAEASPKVAAPASDKEETR